MSEIPKWFWVVLGVIVIAVIAGIMYYNNKNKIATTEDKIATTEDESLTVIDQIPSLTNILG